MIEIPFARELLDAAGWMAALFLLSLTGNILLLRKIFRDVKDKEVALAAIQEKRVLDVSSQIKEFLTTSETLLTQMKYLLNVEIANQQAIETIAKILKKKK